jgi:methionyl-tRNA synthetase
VGKDILTTHAVYWSTMLMGMERPLPQSIFAHGWWTVNGEKMSKSRGNVVDPNTMVEQFGTDAFRYFLLREVPFGQDGDFSLTAFHSRYQAELANDLGNLVSRTLAMMGNFSKNMIPSADSQTETELDHQLQQTASTLFGKIEHHLHGLEFHRALETITGLVHMANQYIDKTAPWVLAKDPEKALRLQTVLFHLAEVLRFLTYALAPFMPHTAEVMKTRLGLTEDSSSATISNYPTWGEYTYINPVTKGASLFPKKDVPTTDESQPASSLPSSPATGKNTEASATPSQPPISTNDTPLIGIEEFQKIQLKVAKILEAERVPKSSKLLRLQVDIGEERRQIVAGIGKKYTPEELVGKTIVVVANLKSAKLMGIESQGMVLAAGENEMLGLLRVSEDLPAGTKVK